MSIEGKGVAVVIVNYKQENYLPALFKSLADQTSSAFSIILINSSPSDFVPLEEAHIINMPSNEGYAAALNRGIDFAMGQGAEALLLLNADTKLDANCIEELMGSYGDIVSPLILLMDRSDRINVAGLKVTKLGVAYCVGYRKPRAWAGLRTKNISAASGAAMFVRSHVFERIGRFDEFFFMYLEDVDFSLRASIAGFKIVLNPKAMVWHKYRMGMSLKKLRWFLKGSGRIRKLLKRV